MARTVTVTLTLPQAEALWSAAGYVLEFPEDPADPNRLRALRNAREKLDAAIDAAGTVEGGGDGDA